MQQKIDPEPDGLLTRVVSYIKISRLANIVLAVRAARIDCKHRPLNTRCMPDATEWAGAVCGHQPLLGKTGCQGVPGEILIII